MILLTRPTLIVQGVSVSLSLTQRGIPSDIFDNKEVLVKIITFNIEPKDDKAQQLSLIEDISKATNQQTPVDEADRRSNDKIQIEIQKELFENYGFYYERKRGEFADGVREKYINRSQIVDRDTFLRLCMACDFRPAIARRTSSKVLFREDNFSKTLSDKKRAHEYFFAYRCYLLLNEIERQFTKEPNNQYGVVNYGQALRYGKYAVISVYNLLSQDKTLERAKQLVEPILSNWLKFEAYAVSMPTNSTYFRIYVDPDTEEKQKELDYSGYYKGRTLDEDLAKFFFEIPMGKLKGEPGAAH